MVSSSMNRFVLHTSSNDKQSLKTDTNVRYTSPQEPAWIRVHDHFDFDTIPLSQPAMNNTQYYPLR